MNQNVGEIRERCKTNTDKEARKEVCVTRIEDVDDVEHEISRRKKKRLEKGRLRESKILDNEAKRKELNTR